MKSSENRPRRVLVLGAGGFLGRHLVEALGERAIPVLRPGARSSSAVISHDLRELDALSGLLDESDASAVINCAALSSPALCEERRSEASSLNTELPRTLGQWSADSGARVIHVSTDLVFGAEVAPEGGFKEEDEPGPISFYGQSKVEGEVALLEQDSASLVVRLPLLYGDPKGTGRGASEALFRLLARGERPSLFTDEWRCPLPVSVAAEALTELVHGQSSGLLHVAGLERVTRFELGLALHQERFCDAERAQVELTGRLRSELDLSPERPEDTSLCSRRAASILTTKLPDLAEGVRLAAYPA
jgi:dTDP-4-dehydrorhamnose reductase